MQFSSLLHNYVITICIVVFGSGSTWVRVWGGLRTISTGKAGVWGANHGGNLYVRVGITHTTTDPTYATSGTGWVYIGKY